MPRGGYRPGAGRPKGAKNKVKKAKPGKKQTRSDIPDDVKTEAAADKLAPLDYMLKVMNDETAEKDRRDRMAQLAAPYVHPKADLKGKKESKGDRAKNASKGKFAPSAPPRLERVK